mgnify:CR=1 FL=1
MSTEYRPLRLMDTFRNLFYTPIYVAVAGGFFYAEGLNVEFSTVPEGQPTMDMLRSGAVDIAQTGISRSLMDLDEGKEDRKSTRLNSSHALSSYAVFCLKKKKK